MPIAIPPFKIGNAISRGFNKQNPPGLQFYADLWHPEQQGFALSYDGNDKLANTTANFGSTDSLGTYELTLFRSASTANNQTLFASSDIGTTTSFFHVYVASTTGRITISTQDNNGTVNTVSGSTNVCDGKNHTIQVKSSGTAWSIILDGVAETLIVVAGTNLGDWFADITLRDNLTIGVKTTTGDGSWAIAVMGQHRIYSRELAVAECLTNYQRGRKATASDTTGLVFNLPTTEGTGNPVDTVGSLTMTLTGATWIESLMDRSTNALPLSSFGSPTWGIQGRTFNGTSSYISGTSISSLTKASDFTLWCWALSNNIGTSATEILVGQGLAADNIVVIEKTGTATILGAVWNGTSYTRKSGTLTSGWHFYVLTYATATHTAAFYIDLVAQSGNASPSADDGAFHIGASPLPRWYFKGIGGEVGGNSRILSTSEYTYIYNATRWRYGV